VRVFLCVFVCVYVRLALPGMLMRMCTKSTHLIISAPTPLAVRDNAHLSRLECHPAGARVQKPTVAARQISSQKVSSLLNLLDVMTAELNFETLGLHHWLHWYQVGVREFDVYVYVCVCVCVCARERARIRE